MGKGRVVSKVFEKDRERVVGCSVICFEFLIGDLPKSVGLGSVKFTFHTND